MKKLIIILLTILFSNFTFSQQTEINWSPFGIKEKKEVLKIAKKFMNAYANSDFQNIQEFLPKGEVNYGGDIWLKTEYGVHLRNGQDERGCKNPFRYRYGIK